MSTTTTSDVAENLRDIKASVTQLCEELKRPEPCIVAVSKTKEAPMVQTAYNAGHRDFGENYVLEFVEKAPKLPDDIKWHFIGHIQSNKVNKLLTVPNLSIVESVDSEKLATKISNAREGSDPLPILLQVNTSGEDSKSGVPPSKAVDLYLKIFQNVDGKFGNILLKGLMTIGKYGGDGTDEFIVLAGIKTEIIKQMKTKNLPEVKIELSMGMSADYEDAIRHGSTNIRVGSTIFGARN